MGSLLGVFTKVIGLSKQKGIIVYKEARSFRRTSGRGRFSDLK